MLYRRQLLLSVVLVVSFFAVASGQRAQPKQQRRSVPVEVYQVVGFPLNIHEAAWLNETRATFCNVGCRVSRPFRFSE
jgi:hypothetical protein